MRTTTPNILKYKVLRNEFNVSYYRQITATFFLKKKTPVTQC